MKLFATALLFAAGSLWAADATLLGLLMPEARVVAGARVDQVRGSQFGQFILAQVPTADLDKIKSETGFDPRTDLTEVVGGAVTEGQAVVAGKGAFQPARIQNLAMTQGAKLENYRGVPIIENSVAFLDASTVVLGKPEAVKGAIDRWLASAQGSGPLVTKALSLSSTSHAWMIATNPSQLNPPPAGPVPPEAQMVQNVLSKINELSGTLNFGDGIALTAQAVTSSNQDAQALADVFQFLMTMAGGKSPLPVTPQISATGTTVNLTATISQQLLEQFLTPQARAARVIAAR